MTFSNLTRPWGDQQPIYRQLRERIVSLILSGSLTEGGVLPSIRQLASDCQINHLTVSKAYQELVDMGLVETRRGMGMYVAEGAAARLLEFERHKFLTQELPHTINRASQLGINPEKLCNAVRSHTSPMNKEQEN